MPENSNNSNSKPSINLSRNSPAALVVGAAGFLGSHISYDLIKKNIELIGLDNFSTGSKQNLEELVRNSKFHFVNSNAENINLSLDRLDYIFIAAGVNWDVRDLLKLAKKNSSKIVFISHINLYEADIDSEFKWFKNTESEISKFASDNKLNARILRLGPVFGPKMSFNIDDPLVKLIISSLEGKLQKEADSLEFSSRALYIKDATNLILRSMLAGATAMKIFDGVGEPVKVTEIKQVLLDPVWYENQGFKPSQLPPWPTPNLEKTKKELNWSAMSNLVTALRETLSYFKDHEISVKQKSEESRGVVMEEPVKLTDQQLWEQEKLRRLQVSDEGKRQERKVNGKNISEKSHGSFGQKFLVLIGLLIIAYGFIYPIFSFGFNVFSYRQNLQKAASSLAEGEFNKSLDSINSARQNLQEVSSLINLFQFLDNVDFARDEYQTVSQLNTAGANLLNASQKSIEGSEALYTSLLNISGEGSSQPDQYFTLAQINFDLADSDFSKVLITLENTNLQIPLLDSQLGNLKARVLVYSNLTKQAKNLSEILPQVIGQKENKSYLVVLMDETQLRSFGGVIVSAAKVNFVSGRINKIEIIDSAKIGSLKLTDEPDFPLIGKELIASVDNQVLGVVAINLNGLSDLMEVTGGINLTGSEDIQSENLLSSAANKKITAKIYQDLLKEFLNKLFFVPQMNWVELTLTLDDLTKRKDLLVYLSDPKLFSYLLDQEITGEMSREILANQTEDFLGVIESNSGNNSANYFIQKNSELETTINNEGIVSHVLKTNYQNSSSELRYQAQVRVYLPSGTKLNKLTLGESEIKNFTTISDYGRTVYSFGISIDPNTSRVLTLNYTKPLGLDLSKKPHYVLNIFKQAGTEVSQFHWNFTKPIIYEIQAQLFKDLEFSIGL